MERQVAVTILIVEDHPPMLAALLAMLSAAFPACRVLTAERGEQALALCASDVPRVVVMDIDLPGIDGIEATRHIKSRHPDIAVVMHSGNDMAMFREAAGAAGASAFVPKYRTYSELVPAITALLPAAFRALAGDR